MSFVKFNSLNGGILNFLINRRLINLFENAKKAYDENQKIKKNQMALEEAAKKKSNENATVVNQRTKFFEIDKKNC